MTEKFSLFDPGSHKKKTPPPKKTSHEKTAPEKKQEAAAPQEKMTLSEMIDRIRHLQNNLDEQLQGVLKQGKYDINKITKFLSNKTNFSEKEWQAIQSHRELIASSLGVKSKELITKEKKVQETRKMVKGRKGKTLGARRKWIDMH